MDIFGRYNFKTKNNNPNLNNNINFNNFIRKGETIDMVNNKIINLATPTEDTDSVTKLYTDQSAQKTLGLANHNIRQFINGKIKMNGDLDMNNHKIINSNLNLNNNKKINFIDEGYKVGKGVYDFNLNQTNVSCFMVFKINSIPPSTGNRGLFGNDNLGWDRFIAIKDRTKILISSVNNGNNYLEIDNPLEVGTYYTLSCHWQGDKGSLWVNGAKLEEFAAKLNSGDNKLYVGGISLNNRGSDSDIEVKFFKGTSELLSTDSSISNIHIDLNKKFINNFNSNTIQNLNLVDKDYLSDELVGEGNRLTGLINDRILRVYSGKLKGGDSIKINPIEYIYKFFLIEYTFHNAFNSGMVLIRNGKTFLPGYFDNIHKNNYRFELGSLVINYDENTRVLSPSFAYRNSDDWKKVNIRNNNDGYYISKIYLL